MLHVAIAATAETPMKAKRCRQRLKMIWRTRRSVLFVFWGERYDVCLGRIRGYQLTKLLGF